MFVFYFIFIVNDDIVFLVSIAKNSFEIGLSSGASSKNSIKKIVIYSDVKKIATKQLWYIQMSKK